MAYVPLGKFDSALHELLYTLACHWDWAGDHDGTVDGFGTYAWAMTIEPDSLSDEQVQEVADEAANIDDEDAELPGQIYGHWMISENSQGFVSVAKWETEELLDHAWQTFEAVYASWSEENPDE